ncbi:ATP-binding cassette domain-containing protein [Motiliproteus coralliicola]|uniref:ATP-binding cassette domain-containing protein n=1 Tax=Motiliproteus coralliicola TaxID=2283196 RepID=A0A369WU62_9GAMM|nr:ATP-binding cassette domain-containing protein [Motiliproteus coralliicola]
MVEISSVSAFREDLQVFDELSFCLAPQQRVAILGPNGSGKSSLLKLISREIYPVVRPNSYVRLYGSETVDLWDLRRKIGLVSHDLQVDYTPYSTGLEVVLSGFFGAIGAHTHLQPNPQQIALAREAIASLGVSKLEGRMYQRMSTGQQRRFLLARALIHQPELLIMDEPSAGLDIGAAYQLLETLRQLCQSERALLLATHHVEEIIPEIERVVLIMDGKILADGPKAEVLTSENLSRLYGLQLQLQQSRGWYRLSW